jgi:N6-L-threonylcarbamoyladenine synthase
MRLLSIETSCDETAIAILECAGDELSATFTVQSHALLSQIDIHREFGGVFPAVRELLRKLSFLKKLQLRCLMKCARK